MTLKHARLRPQVKEIPVARRSYAFTRTSEISSSLFDDISHAAESGENGVRDRLYHVTGKADDKHADGRGEC